ALPAVVGSTRSLGERLLRERLLAEGAARTLLAGVVPLFVGRHVSLAPEGIGKPRRKDAASASFLPERRSLRMRSVPYPLWTSSASSARKTVPGSRVGAPVSTTSARRTITRSLPPPVTGAVVNAPGQGVIARTWASISSAGRVQGIFPSSFSRRGASVTRRSFWRARGAVPASSPGR